MKGVILDRDSLGDDLDLTPITTLLDRHGEEFLAIGGGHDEWLTRDDIPQTLVEAVLAIEDRRFYDHGGVDYREFCDVGTDWSHREPHTIDSCWCGRHHVTQSFTTGNR